MIRLTDEREAQHGAQLERVEQRLKAIEESVTIAGVKASAQIETKTGSPT